MSNRALQALDFIKRYFAKWGGSPSLRELGAELGVSPKRAQELVSQLSRDEQIRVVKGKRRGISLIDRGEQLSEAELLLQFAKRGYKIVAGDKVLHAPLTKNGLPDVLFLDHKP